MLGRTSRLPATFIGSLIFQLVLAGTSFGGYTDGLAGYWQFNGDGNDSSGNGNNLALVGSPNFGPGLFGQAMSLHNDSSQYAVNSGNASAFGLGSSDFTIQVWVNFNGGINGREQTLLEKFAGSAGPGWTLTTPGGNGIQFFANGVGVLNSQPMTFTTGVWNQVIVRRSGSQFDMFYDGADIASFSSGGTISSTTNPLLFGKRDDQDGRDFALDGRLDEVGIWSRALSNSEIAGLYNGGVGLSLAAVPEPSSLTLCGVASLMGVTIACRRRKA